MDDSSLIRGLAVVVRKGGFQSERIFTQNAPSVRIVLRPADKHTFPGCEKGRDYVGLEAHDFRFPRLPGITYGSPGSDRDVSESVEYQEIVYPLKK